MQGVRIPCALQAEDEQVSFLFLFFGGFLYEGGEGEEMRAKRAGDAEWTIKEKGEVEKL